MSMELGPYTNFHELNLDWFLNEFNKVLAEWAAMNKRFSDLNAAFNDLRNYVHDYFNNLDVQEEIDNKLNSMAADGSLYEIIRRYTDPIVNEQDAKITVLENRMNTFASLPEGSTTGDAELQDIRVGYDGNVYHSAGDAVRGQVSELKSDLIQKAYTNEKILKATSKSNFCVDNGVISNTVVSFSKVVETDGLNHIMLATEYTGNRFFAYGANSLEVGNSDVTLLYDSKDTVSYLRTYNIELDTTGFRYVIVVLNAVSEYDEANLTYFFATGLKDELLVNSHKVFTKDRTNEILSKNRVKTVDSNLSINENNVVISVIGVRSYIVETKKNTNYKISLTGEFNRFFVSAHKTYPKENLEGTLLFNSVDTMKQIGFVVLNSGDNSYMLITTAYNMETYNAEISVVENHDLTPLNAFGVNVEEDENRYADCRIESFGVSNGIITNSPNMQCVVADVKSFNEVDLYAKYYGNRFYAYGTNSLEIGNSDVTLLYTSDDVAEYLRNYSIEKIDVSSYDYIVLTITAYECIPQIDKFTVFEHKSNVIVKGCKVTRESDVKELLDDGAIYKEKTFAKTFTTSTQVINAFDTLMSNHTDYITRNDLGVDSVGNHIYEYVFGTGRINDYKEHNRPIDSAENKPSILLLTGIHGYERSCVMGTYLFAKALCEEKIFSKIKNKYIIKIIPLSVPSAYDLNDYLNSNGVNIDCNFDFNWSKGAGWNPNGEAPADQLETQILQEWMNNNTDALVMINYHNSGYTEEISYMSGNSSHLTTETFKNKYFDAMYRIEDYLKQTYPKDNAIYGYTGYYDLPTGYNYANKVGLIGLLLEASWNVTNGGTNNDSTSNRANAEILGNLILEYFD